MGLTLCEHISVKRLQEEKEERDVKVISTLGRLGERWPAKPWFHLPHSRIVIIKLKKAKMEITLPKSELKQMYLNTHELPHRSSVARAFHCKQN